jgi:putative sigma-54 modulation protein
MRLELTGRHIDITPALRRLVDRKLDPLRRVLNDRMVSLQVHITRERNRKHVEATLHARGEKFFHGVGDHARLETSLTSAFDKIEQQAQKVKGKWEGRRRRGPRGGSEAPAPRGPETSPSFVVRTVRYPVKPMTVEEAALQFEDASAAFLVFRNAQNDQINVLYRRKNGGLALIEP